MWMNNKVIFLFLVWKIFIDWVQKKMPAYFSGTALQLDL